MNNNNHVEPGEIEKVNGGYHTMQEDFEHFLSYSGLWREPDEIKAKLFQAFEAAWEPLDGFKDKLIKEQREAAEFMRNGEAWELAYDEACKWLKEQRNSQEVGEE